MKLNFAVNSIDELKDFSVEELKKFEYVTVSYGEESTVYTRDRGYELHYKITKYCNSVAFSSESETVVRIGDKLIKEGI